jgi:hypothetical protein
MQTRPRLVVLSVAGVLALASVAIAKPPHPAHPNHPNNSGNTNNSGKSKKCATHKVAYVASGTLVSWGATAGTDGTFSGPVSFTLSHANHHVAGTKGTTVMLTLGASKLTLGVGVTSPMAGDKVKVIGKITQIAKKCTNQTGAGVVTVRKITVTAAH